MHFQLDKFKVPANFRGGSKIKTQLWWTTQALLFNTSPQFLYAWRRFLLRLFGAQIGKKVLLRPSAKITYPWKVTIGDNSWIGDDVVLYSLGEICIGENSVISQKSYLCTGSHDYAKSTFDIYSKNIAIGNSVWIATDVFIAPGVTVADMVVVAARSSVTKDILKPGIYGGTPSKFIKDRE